MDVQYKGSFKKDLKRIRDEKLLHKVSEIIYEVKAATNIHEIKNLKKIQEEKSYFPSIRISKYLPVRCLQTGRREDTTGKDR